MTTKINISHNPAISVIMSVYKTDSNYLKESIESILNQTFEDFEFIIILDGPNKLLRKIINSYKDPRIRIIENSHNIGLTKSLNKGINLARGKYIARMDSDDVSIYTRFARQLEFLEKHRDVLAVGGLGVFTDRMRVGVHTTRDHEIMPMRMLFQNVGIVHPTALIRSDVFKKLNIKYDEKLVYAQDYDLWVRILEYGKIALIPEVVLLFRSHPNRISSKYKEKQYYYANLTKKRQLLKFNSSFSQKELEILYSFETGELITNINEYKSFMRKLINFNDQITLFDRKKFIREVKFQWIQFVLKRLVTHKKIDALLSYFTLSILLSTNWHYLYRHIIQNRLLERKIIKKFLKQRKNNEDLL